jgi:hypothetical protein
MSGIYKVAECIICGQKDSMMRQCNECNLHVCTEHRLPEKHNCPALLESSDDQESDEQWFDEKFQDVDSERVRQDSNRRFRRVIGLLLIVIITVSSLIYFGAI